MGRTRRNVITDVTSSDASATQRSEWILQPKKGKRAEESSFPICTEPRHLVTKTFLLTQVEVLTAPLNITHTSTTIQ